MSEQITVVKFGSELVANGLGVNQSRINEYADGLVESYGDGGLMVVTSGAVAAGRARLESKGTDTARWSKVTLAQLGSASITHAWETAFDLVDRNAGGLLTTHHEIEDRQQGPVLARAIKLAFERGVISIVNENDALSDDELMKLACGGDNDGLASHIARVIGADSLKLFTKKGGILDEDDNLITEITADNRLSVRDMLKVRQSNQDKLKGGKGRGGMLSKLDAAWAAAEAGVKTDIAATNLDMTGAFVTTIVVG